jgi:hypothetical protein
MDVRAELSRVLDPIGLVRGAAGNPVVQGVVQRGMEARDRALAAQEAMLGALNLPTAADVATIAGRLRSLSQRLELLEDTIARVDVGVQRLPQLLDHRETSK